MGDSDDRDRPRMAGDDANDRDMKRRTIFF